MVAAIVVLIPIVILTLIFGFVKVGIKRLIPGIERIFWPLVVAGWFAWMYVFFDQSGGMTGYFEGAEGWQVMLCFFIISIFYWGAVLFVKILTHPIDWFDGLYKDVAREEREKNLEYQRKMQAEKDEDPELKRLLERLGH